MSASDTRRWLDPVLACLFLLLGGTGLFLLLGSHERWIRELHEGIGALFLCAAATHIFLNRKTLGGYFKPRP